MKLRPIGIVREYFSMSLCCALGASGLRGWALANEDTCPFGCGNVPAALYPGIPVVSQLVWFGHTYAGITPLALYPGIPVVSQLV